MRFRRNHVKIGQKKLLFFVFVNEKIILRASPEDGCQDEFRFELYNFTGPQSICDDFYITMWNVQEYF